MMYYNVSATKWTENKAYLVLKVIGINWRHFNRRYKYQVNYSIETQTDNHWLVSLRRLHEDESKLYITLEQN